MLRAGLNRAYSAVSFRTLSASVKFCGVRTWRELTTRKAPQYSSHGAYFLTIHLGGHNEIFLQRQGDHSSYDLIVFVRRCRYERKAGSLHLGRTGGTDS